MKTIILAIILTISAQAFISSYKVKSNCDKQKQAEFILKCIENANPKSDEEPEDWITICQAMSEDLFCTISKRATYWENNMFSADINCDCASCSHPRAKASCRANGWAVSE